MRADFITDRFDEYISPGCVRCASGCATLTLDTVVYAQRVRCAACHHEMEFTIPARDETKLAALIEDGTAIEAFTMLSAWIA